MATPVAAATIMAMRSTSIITTSMATPVAAAMSMAMRSMSIITMNMATPVAAAMSIITMNIITSTALLPARKSTSSRTWVAHTALPRWKRKSTPCPA